MSVLRRLPLLGSNYSYFVSLVVLIRLRRWNANNGKVMNHSQHLSAKRCNLSFLNKSAAKSHDTKALLQGLPYHGFLQAFSHWTYEITGQAILVCDLQGIFKMPQQKKRAPTFVLTDPVIHEPSGDGENSERKRLNGNTDFGESGVQDFFDTHVCNGVCKLLGLRNRADDGLVPLTDLARQYAKGAAAAEDDEEEPVREEADLKRVEELARAKTWNGIVTRLQSVVEDDLKVYYSAQVHQQSVPHIAMMIKDRLVQKYSAQKLLDLMDHRARYDELSNEIGKILDLALQNVHAQRRNLHALEQMRLRELLQGGEWKKA